MDSTPGIKNGWLNTSLPIRVEPVSSICTAPKSVGYVGNTKSADTAAKDAMLWLSLAIVTIFGGLTIWLHNPLFIKWKPTILYWVFASILIYGSMTGKNFIHKLIGAQIALPANIWKNLQKGWIGFFIVVGFINLAVAYSFSTEAWVNFKLFGLLGLTLAFTLAMGFYIAKYSPESLEDNVKSDAAPK